MKKKIIYVCILLVCCALIYFVYIESAKHSSGDDKYYNDMVSYLNKDVDLAILLYGDDIKFPDGLDELEIIKIESLKPDNYNYDNDYVFLYINDLSGNNIISNDEIDELIEYAESNANFNFYYIGTLALPIFQEKLTDCNLNDGDMSFGYVMDESIRMQTYGLWTVNDNQYIEKNPYLLGENICHILLQDIKANE